LNEKQNFWLIPGSAFSIFLCTSKYYSTPVFSHKDGEANSGKALGSEKDIIVNGANVDPTKGWILFNLENVDLTNVVSVKLSLYVKTLTNPGTLTVSSLKTPITNPENHVQVTDIVLIQKYHQ
jgi:hypothetical protein